MIDAVHQFLPTYAARDAVGTHVRHAQAVLRQMGLRSEVYAEGRSGVGFRAARDVRSYRGDGSRTLLVYQLSTGSKVADFVLARPEPKVVNYHNITPAELFAPWEPHVGGELAKGRRQLEAFAAAAFAGIAVSRYNEGDLRAAGFSRTDVAPVMVDLDALEKSADPRVLGDLQRAKRRGGADLLFVGRVAPNKAHHDLIKAFVAYRRVYDPEARLHVVGGASSHAYLTAMKKFAKGLGVQRWVDFAGSVPDGTLAAYYRTADAFVCLSDHEGFCVPLLEAMHNRVPIVAFGAAAVPETVADAGLVLPSKEPALVAAAVHRVVTDEGVRCRLTAAGSERLTAFSLDKTKAAFRRSVEAVLADL
ncbi:MAG: glycosyltransferase family 4 protein [Actinomycetota bacterium]|nr:glycosyltransferase family 4 protein [Actinomycetota bacterium]